MAWNFLKTTPKFDKQELKIKDTIESMLSTLNTTIDIDSINMTFTLLNSISKCNIHVDSVGIKVDIKHPERLIALDVKLDATKLTFFKDLIAQEASKRRQKQVEDVFLNRMDSLDEVIKHIKDENNTERN